MKCRINLLLLIIVILLFSCSQKAFEHNVPTSKKGIINLEKWDFKKNGSIKLDGEWEFYWNKMYTPEDFKRGNPKHDFYIKIPDKWNDYKIKAKKLPAIGHGTYRIKVILPENNSDSKLLLKIPSVYSSYNCWFNDKFIFKKGNPSTSLNDFKGSNYPEILDIAEGNNILVITLNVSNYFFSMSGGIINSLYLGTLKDILSMTQRNVFFYIVSFGIFIIMFIYHLWLWILRRKDIYNLFFSAICFLMALQSLFISERSIYYIINDLDMRLFFQLWYLVFAIFPIALLFFKEFFPDEINKYAIYFFLIIFIFCIILNFVLPSRIFTSIAPYFYFIGILLVIYIVVANIYAIINKREFAVLFFTGMIIPAFSALNDSLYSMGIIKTIFITPLGFGVYLTFQSYLISYKFTKSFSQVEVLTLELDTLNKTLERRIDIRTKSLHEALVDVEKKNMEISKQNKILGKMHRKLSKANLRLQSLASIDHLTGLANRRLLFDFYNYEWKHSLRQKYPLSVVFIDVDFFKQFNDTYGHIKGDEVLKKISSILTDVARRTTDVAARFGGEEFILILSNTNINGALMIAENIKNNVEDLKIEHKISSVLPYVTVSIGVSSIVPTKEQDPNTLITLADNALYKAKESGRNRIEVTELEKV